MKIIRCKKKGMTLIEAIISVALLSVLIIPISGLVMTSINTNKRAEIKQEATYIGQKLLEEMKVYDEIILGVTKEFQLLNGQKITKVGESDNFVGKFIVDKYDVELSLNKDNQFVYDNNIVSNEINTNEMDVVVEFVSNNTIKYNNVNYVISDNLTIKTPNNDTDELEVINGNGTVIFKVTKASERKNKILFVINNDFKGDVNIDFHNERDEEVSIYVKKNSAVTGNLNINAFRGKIRIYNNINNKDKNKIGNLYNINVVVKNKGNELFKGEVLQNILIK
ncbi:Tfp pilus assembly protein PilV [uncultured Clostridium sp.]|uniref:type IV pilus modification PilV family protein n=1 Tax=uncultured Clostridium sp. TaxID=59620 RepID=UPI000821BC30|nr:prepilin-type N-terminal cleavage/methylation domain-containing protein [uncultured Clostridium sp.]SCK00894.1 Tfp pilus assembly protein PilV [uncultured Clostridium sp.]